MPAQDRVRIDEDHHVRQGSPPEAVARRGESASVRIGQARTSSAQVFFEDAVLFRQVFDYLKLVAIHPPSQGHEEDPPSDGVEQVPSLQVGPPLAPL